jgi:hypothetical protein
VLRGTRTHVIAHVVRIQGDLFLSSLPRLWLRACPSTGWLVIILESMPNEASEEYVDSASLRPIRENWVGIHISRDVCSPVCGLTGK